MLLSSLVWASSWGSAERKMNYVHGQYFRAHTCNKSFDHDRQPAMHVRLFNYKKNYLGLYGVFDLLHSTIRIGKTTVLLLHVLMF